jgi:hypothetical protein
MEYHHHSRPSLPPYRDLHYDYKDRYIESLETQIHLYRTKIDELEQLVSSVNCYKCHNAPLLYPRKYACQTCSEQENVPATQLAPLPAAPVAPAPRLKGPACDACRIRKRKCDRGRPFCSHCIKLHKNKPGLPNCHYPESKTKLSDSVDTNRAEFNDYRPSVATPDSNGNCC